MQWFSYGKDCDGPNSKLCISPFLRIMLLHIDKGGLRSILTSERNCFSDNYCVLNVHLPKNPHLRFHCLLCWKGWICVARKTRWNLLSCQKYCSQNWGTWCYVIILGSQNRWQYAMLYQLLLLFCMGVPYMTFEKSETWCFFYF